MLIIRSPLVSVALGVFVLCLCGHAAIAQEKEKLAEVTKKELNTKVPNFFCLGSNEDSDSKRLWLRIDSKHFVERYPSGAESKFRILGRTKIDGTQGTLLAKVGGDEQEAGTPNDGSFQVFIPDRGSAKMEFRFRQNPQSDWAVFTEIRKVE
jgi:hypothetical protein